VGGVVALDGRLRRLEDRLRRPDDPMSRPVDPDWLAVLEEYGRLKGSMAETSYRGSPNGLVWIPPENIPEKVLGPTYTQRQFCELAVSRGLKKRGHSASEIAELLPGYLAFLEEGPRDEHIGAVD
jgi:hypothetical protein